MKQFTREKWEQYQSQIAIANEVKRVDKQFAVTIPVTQRLENDIQLSDSFLQEINFVPVTDSKGEKVRMGINGSIARRTAITDTTERVPRDHGSVDGPGYETELTEYDIATPYSKLDAWARFPDFNARYQAMVARQIGLDRLTIGFNGTSAAATTNPTTNTLLQDVNIGWLQKLKTEAASNVFTAGATTNQIRIGEGGDYANIDHFVSDLNLDLLAEETRDREDLVLLIGRGWIAERVGALYGNTTLPTERHAMNALLNTLVIGGLKVRTPSMFPTYGIMITTPENLSIYVQEGTMRRHMEEQPKKNRVADFMSMNEAYVIENPKLMVAAEHRNIRTKVGTNWVDPTA